MKFHRPLLVLAVASVLTMTLAACGSSSETPPGDESTAGGGTLTIGSVAPTTFDASELQYGPTVWYAQAAYDTILHLDPATNEVVPWLATEWSWDESKTVLTMTVRDDVTFSDGTELNADAIAQNLLRFRDGSAPDKSQLALVQDAEAIDETTVEITLTAPDPSLLTNLTQAPGLIASPAAFESGNLATEPIGSGPFVMNTGDTVAGSAYVFDKNEDYWAADTVDFDKLVISVLPTPQAMLNAIKGGQVDVASLFDNTLLPQTEAAGFTTTPMQINWAGIILFDRNGELTPALKEPKVRQALNYAVDRESMLQAVGNGYGIPTSSTFSASSSIAVPELDSYYTYDPEEAKQLLTEAGYPDGFTIDMPRITGFGETANDLLQGQLAEVGVKMNFTAVALADIVGELLAPKYSASYFELQQDPNAFQAANFLVSADAAWNPFGVTDPTIEGYIDTMQTGTEEEAVKASQDLNRYTVEQAWNVPLYRTQTSLVTSPKVALKTAPTENNGYSYAYLYNLGAAE
jgi:peptide/nickel transport system substrate-binding protein